MPNPSLSKQNPTFRIRPAHPSDLLPLSDLSARANLTNELDIHLFPYRHRHPKSYAKAYYRDSIPYHTDPFTSLLVCVVRDGSVEGWEREKCVGYASWRRETRDAVVRRGYDSRTRLERTWGRCREWVGDTVRPNWSYSACGIKGAWRGFVMDWRSRGEKHPEPEENWSLDFLVVDPDWQRRGVGTMLFEWGKQRAVEDKVPVMVMSTVAGRALYRRMGCEEWEGWVWGPTSGRTEEEVRAKTLKGFMWFPDGVEKGEEQRRVIVEEKKRRMDRRSVE
jgi:ribosomal protein S18 acetylase RimI-like enzyme